jgi:hypothetical protein
VALIALAVVNSFMSFALCSGLSTAIPFISTMMSPFSKRSPQKPRPG